MNHFTALRKHTRSECFPKLLDGDNDFTIQRHQNENSIKLINLDVFLLLLLLVLMLMGN